MRRLSLISLLCIFALILPVSAQDGNQFCVRSYEDRNANQMRDASEPLLTSGIGADLMEENGIVIGSALLSESPSAAQGIICFVGLAPAQYTIQVTSAEYVATTPGTMTVAFVGDELPAVLEFGAQSITAALDTPLNTLEDENPQWPRVLMAAAGAIVALFVMQLLGIVVYLLFFRSKAVPVTSTQTVDAVKSDTAQFKRPDA